MSAASASRRRPIVAIDGPAGAGKTTVTRLLAEALDYLRVDTGAVYRCVALACQRAGVDWGDTQAVSKVAAGLVQREAIHFVSSVGGQQVWLDDEDVSLAIRSQDMGQGASRVSALPPVREALLELQRQLGREGGVVVEGRDIGTVVFPDAEAKFFLTASVTVRALRRHQELVKKGQATSLEDVENEVRVRDERDTNRPVAPLALAEDAQLVDSTELSLEAVVAQMAQRVRSLEGSRVG